MQKPTLTDCSLTCKGGVAILTFDRHDVRNALTGTAIADDIVAVVEWVNQDADVAVLIITGEGSAFSAGGNIKDMLDKHGDFAGDVETLEQRYRQGIQRIPKVLYRCEVPVIAAVNGPAIGAGFDIANMCDIRIASDKAKFGETFINLGIIPGDGGAWFMQRLIGYQQAAHLTFTGEVIDAYKAKELGIVLSVVPNDELQREALKLATEMAAKPTHALRMSKRLMQMAQRTELNDFLDVCATFQGICHNNPEHIDAVKALIDKLAKKS
ncbi:enoyl-CoA hydratase-related protein [Thalassotalea sediminis]|uniref:enoyl-CoA hydratase-related protein n=1 Tax=Thalassotalea sediminis TaxID=1759089 RepID=UPI002574822F|nr:enoyl-CoA hydratase-related protein [Thalassotalea sediminis]